MHSYCDKSIESQRLELNQIWLLERQAAVLLYTTSTSMQLCDIADAVCAHTYYTCEYMLYTTNKKTCTIVRVNQYYGPICCGRNGCHVNYNSQLQPQFFTLFQFFVSFAWLVLTITEHSNHDPLASLKDICVEWMVRLKNIKCLLLILSRK